MSREFIISILVERDSDEEYASDIEGVKALAQALDCMSTYEIVTLERVAGHYIDLK